MSPRPGGWTEPEISVVVGRRLGLGDPVSTGVGLRRVCQTEEDRRYDVGKDPASRVDPSP